MKKLLLLPLLCVFGFSQAQMGIWQTLFQDQSKNIGIEIKIEQKKDSCGDGMVHTHTYSYRMDPTYSQLPPYLIWKMDLVDCDGYFRTQYRTLELDQTWTRQGGEFENPNDKFIASKINIPFYGATYSNVPNNKSEVVLVKSTPPDEINGDDSLMFGASTQLSVKGGMLGHNASWVWYENRCGVGKSIGEGPSIMVEPSSTTTYFVRAEAQNDITACASIIVNVDNRSRQPQSVKAEATVVCKGSSVKLTVEGGGLGKGASWIWTKDRCDGPEVGRGSTLNSTVNERTTFFVKAVGSSNTTDCVSQTISVSEPMVEPYSIESSVSNDICEGELVQLEVKSAVGDTDGIWYWTTQSCGDIGNSLGEGDKVAFNAKISTTIFVTGKNICGNTKCISMPLVVKKKSIAPISISAPDQIIKGRKISYRLIGGELGAGAQWKWYKNDQSKPMAYGDVLQYKTRKQTTLSVKAIGFCNETDFVSRTLYPIKESKKRNSVSKGSNDRNPYKIDSKSTNRRLVARKMENRYTSEYYSNKSFSIGIGLGFQSDANEVSVSGISPFLIDASNGSFITDTMFTEKSAFVISLPIFPLMKKNVSIGFIPEFNYSYVNSYISSDVPLLEEFNLDYEEYTFKLVTDAAFGSNGFKLFSRYGISFSQLDNMEPYPDFDPTFDPIMSIIQYPDVIRHDDIHFGLRLGNYIRTKRNSRTGLIKPTVWYDIYYIARKSSVQRKHDSHSALVTFGNSATGYGLSIWKQNKFKIIFESYFTPNSNDGLVFHSGGLATTVGFQFCLNGFR